MVLDLAENRPNSEMIIKKGYSGITFQLVDSTTGKAVEVGEKVVNFRGESAVLTGGRAPHKPASSGHVSVKRQDCDHTGESYAGVYGLKWKMVQ